MYSALVENYLFFFSSRRRQTRCSRDWSSDVCSSDLWAWPPRAVQPQAQPGPRKEATDMEMKQKASLFREFTKGIFRENPILIIMLGLCPTLAVSTSAGDAFGMAMAFTFVVTCSNIVVSLIRKAIPAQVRIPVFITVISPFVTIADYSLKAFA